MGLVALWSFSYSCGHPPLALLLLAAGLAGAFAGERFDLSKNQLGFICVGLLALVFATSPEAPPGNRLFEPAMGPAYRGGLVAAALVVLLLFRRCPGGQVFLRLAASLGLMLAAGVVREVLPFGYFVGLEMVLVLLYLRARSSGSLKLVTTGSLVATILVALLTSALAASLHWTERQLGDVLSLLSGSSGSAVFSAKSDFSWARRRQTSTKVVARAVCPNQPLYMVGMRYLTYGNQRWTVAGGKTDLPVLKRAATQTTFGKAPGTVTMEVEFTSLPVVTLLQPLGLQTVTAQLENLRVGPLGTLYLPAKEKFYGNYTLTTAEGPQPGTPVEECLALPKNCPPIVLELAEKLVRQAPTPAVAVNQVESYLRANYEYGFGHKFAKDQDPIEIFLEEKRPAHCEVFATSMALILRAGGIPCRYINGFIMAEKSRWGDFWVSRDRDAHAWVEAYVEGQGWVTADPTPPTALESPPVSGWRELFEWTTTAIRRTILKLRQGQVPKLPLFLILAALAAWKFRWRPRWQRRSRPESALPNPKVEQLQRLLERLEELQEGPRPKHLTVLEWAQQLGEPARPFLELYSRSRYSSEEPVEEEVEQLASLLDRLEPS